MPLYDVVLEVTYRVGARDQDDTAIQVHLTAQEALFGEIMVNSRDSTPEDWQRRVDERTAATGISLRQTACERVVTPHPYDLGQLATG